MSFLCFLRIAHRLQNIWVLLLFALSAVLSCMLKVLPARVQRAISHSILFRAQQGMVSTRRQRCSQEGMQQVLERLHSLPQQQHEPISNKLAAVLVALFEAEDGAVRVWLTQRAQHLNSHQGEVCLPGGKRDATDPDDAFTAKREAEEELGLQPSAVQVICQMAPMLSKHLLSVTAVVAQVPSTFIPQPNADEVQAVFSMPLSCFLDSQRHLHWDVRSKSNPGRVYRVHSFDYQGHVVWGLTAAILIQVAEVALGRPPDFEVDHPSNISTNNQSRM